MRRITKKDLNLNKLKTGCSPCLEEAKIMQRKIDNRKLSEIKIKEINLDKLKTGCAPCMNEAKKMALKISSRNISEIKVEEIKITLGILYPSIIFISLQVVNIYFEIIY